MTLGLLLIFVAVVAYPSELPLSMLVLPLVVAQVLLPPRQLPGFVALVWLLTAVAVVQRPYEPRTLVFAAVTVALGSFVLWVGLRRSALGIGGAQSEAMFLDLRERIQRETGRVEVPSDWYADVAFRAAGNTPFAGDFVVSHRDGPWLHVAVVDVSGKGLGAGTRALHLTGALSGLIGAVPPERLLVEANDYLLRQDWQEGFATAIHVTVHLPTGRTDIRCAGHPPALLLRSGSGRWTSAADPGPALGLLPGAEFPVVRREMRRGDVLLLCTDGLVESSDLELHQGIDRLLGQAERELRRGLEGGAQRLIDVVRADDDQLLLLLHRR